MIDGLWPEIVGSKCTLRAAPVGYNHREVWKGAEDSFVVDQEFTIETVYYRVTRDGRVWPVFKLEGIDNHLFRPEELCIEAICQAALSAGDLCGEFYA